MKVSERKAVSIKMGMIEWLWKGGRVCMVLMHMDGELGTSRRAWDEFWTATHA